MRIPTIHAIGLLGGSLCGAGRASFEGFGFRLPNAVSADGLVIVGSPDGLSPLLKILTKWLLLSFFVALLFGASTIHVYGATGVVFTFDDIVCPAPVNCTTGQGGFIYPDEETGISFGGSYLPMHFANTVIYPEYRHGLVSGDFVGLILGSGNNEIGWVGRSGLSTFDANGVSLTLWVFGTSDVVSRTIIVFPTKVPVVG